MKQAIDHGLILEKIHRCIRFKQSPWMKEYIDFNTRLRTATKNDDLKGCEMGKVKVVMNKPVYLGQAISNIIMYEFHHDYMLPKYGNDIKLCYMDTDSFVYDTKSEDFYKDIAEDVETRFDTSGYCNNRPLTVGKNKKVIG